MSFERIFLILILIIFSLSSSGQSYESDCSTLDSYELLFFTSSSEDETYRLVATLSDSIRSNPNKPSFYFLRGMNKSNLSDNRGAIEDYKFALKILETKPFHDNGLLIINTNLAMSKSLVMINEKDNALEFANMALAAATRWPGNSKIFDKVYFYRGVAYFASGNLEMGCKDMSKAGENGCRQAFKAISIHCQ